MRTQRQLQVGEEIRHALAAALQREEFHWPEGVQPGYVSVTEVRVSPDLKNATAFVMPLGGKQLTETVKALNDGIGFFRHAVAKAVQLRMVPRLVFAADTSFDYAAKIETLLDIPEVAKDVT
jgi:ribosome-binding factor A